MIQYLISTVYIHVATYRDNAEVAGDDDEALPEEYLRSSLAKESQVHCTAQRSSYLMNNLDSQIFSQSFVLVCLVVHKNKEPFV